MDLFTKFNKENREAKKVLGQAMVFLRNRKYKEAIEALDPLLQEEQGQDKYSKKIYQGIWYVLASANQGLSRHEEAATYFALCLKSDSRDEELLFSAGLTYVALKQKEKAVECLRSLSKHHGLQSPFVRQLENQIQMINED